jgi:hypothetical protein
MDGMFKSEGTMAADDGTWRTCYMNVSVMQEERLRRRWRVEVGRRCTETAAGS